MSDLADLLERVLDKGVVVVGDISVSVVDIELLSLKVRLFIASAQTARELGMDWWARDPYFTTQVTVAPPVAVAAPPVVTALGADALAVENAELRRRLAELEAQVPPT